ncbi:citrate lyase acyl carrier protein [Candidatus Margulisiibacteriota bacterium]
MEIQFNAQAGTFESSDIMVLIEKTPDKSGRKIELESAVIYEYGDKVKAQITEILDKYDINDVNVIAKDKGALDATVRARVETAVLRSLGQEKGTFL